MRAFYNCLAGIAVWWILGTGVIQSQATAFIMTIRVMSAEDGAVGSGQNAVLEVRMVNGSDHTVVISEGNPAGDYAIDISDAHGIRPADTDYGLKLKKSAASPRNMMLADRNISLTLKPGEAGTVE